MVPPQNLEAERATLGAMLLEGEAAGLALEILNPKDFYNPAHREIFEAIEAVCDSGEDPDEILTASFLEGTHALDGLGPDYIHQLVLSTPSAANIEKYADLVRGTSIRRQLIMACVASMKDAQDEGIIEDILDRCEGRIYEITGDKLSSSVTDVDKIIEENLQLLKECEDNPEKRLGIMTHLPSLDKLTGGFQKTDLILLAARPSVGKTSLVMDFAYHAAAVAKKPILLFSLEMSKKQVGNRVLGGSCRIPSDKLRYMRLNPIDWKRINRLGKVENFKVDDTASIPMSEIRSKSRRMRSRHDIQMIIVDYIQLVRGPQNQKREREVAMISASLKALAKELNVPVIGVCQLNRVSEERVDGEPRVHDLRESGALEQDADVVLLLHRKRMRDGTHTNDGYLRVAKQRNGPIGKIPLVYVAEYMSFLEVADVDRTKEWSS